MNPAETITALILNKSYTKSQISRRTRLIKEFLHYKLFQSQITEETKLLEDFLNQNQVLKPDQDWFIDTDRTSLLQIIPMQLERLLKEVDTKLNDLPVVMVYVPFQIKDEHYFTQSLQQIGEWFKKNLSTPALFELIYQPTLIGGAAFSLGGIYKDYSLKYKLEQKRDAVIQAISTIKNK